jgi:amino acid transporter
MSSNHHSPASWIVPKKLAVYLLFVVLAIVVSGLYGILHDQISYTVAPEYFTKFKFRQFGMVDTPLPERVRASLIGFLASWWMGIPIGLLVGAAGFIHRGAGRMLRISLWSMLVAVVFTLLFGLVGLLYGYLQTAHIELVDYRGWFIPDDVTDLRRFLCCGYMHNSSYLGGVLAILVAWAFHVVAAIRARGGH